MRESFLRFARTIAVIASEAKQSSGADDASGEMDCFVAPLLAMTIQRVADGSNAR